MYIDYSTYLDMGGSVDDWQFNRLAYRAEKLIDKYTQSRLKPMWYVPDEVQHCMVELINAMSAADPTEVVSKPVLSGFNNDGYSESYATPMTAETLETGLYRILVDYLHEVKDDKGTPLLYLGVR